MPRNVTRVDPSLPGVMDYCLPCRRHLNGALVCPGCGTPADRIPGPAAVEPEPGEPEKGSGEGYPEGKPAGGRAERRGRKAAAHRRRRRRTVLLAAGFVLAAGGLGFAELGTDAPLPFTGGGTATVKDTSADDGDSSGPSGRTTAPPQVTNVSATSGATASASGSPSAGATGSGSPSATAGGTTKAPPSATTAPGSPVTAPTAPPPTRPTAAPPTTAPATSAPPPAPSPTRTCDRFLWWCT
ncbi:hypothetical protein GCM10023100_53970 [Actinocorallia cavernae]|uniref:Zinc ribbon domain-containing protein n=3 Tax=Actinomycetota TaxID=201174 RepID=A0ABP8SYY5_9ACTN